MGDFRDILSDAKTQDKFFDRAKYSENCKLWDLMCFEKQSREKDLWEIPYLRDESREDNDTSDEEPDISSRFKSEVFQCLQKGISLRKIGSSDEFRYFLAQAMPKNNESGRLPDQLDKEECLQKEGKLVSGHNKDLCESFTWYKQEEDHETYFCLVNTARRVFKQGDQQWNHYGRRSNKYLLIHYGFCFENNKYDSFEFGISLDF